MVKLNVFLEEHLSGMVKEQYLILEINMSLRPKAKQRKILKYLRIEIGLYIVIFALTAHCPAMSMSTKENLNYCPSDAQESEVDNF